MSSAIDSRYRNGLSSKFTALEAELGQPSDTFDVCIGDDGGPFLDIGHKASPEFIRAARLRIIAIVSQPLYHSWLCQDLRNLAVHAPDN
jgi:hypothetical protein